MYSTWIWNFKPRNLKNDRMFLHLLPADTRNFRISNRCLPQSLCVLIFYTFLWFSLVKVLQWYGFALFFKAFLPNLITYWTFVRSYRVVFRVATFPFLAKVQWAQCSGDFKILRIPYFRKNKQNVYEHWTSFLRVFS